MYIPGLHKGRDLELGNNRGLRHSRRAEDGVHDGLAHVDDEAAVLAPGQVQPRRRHLPQDARGVGVRARNLLSPSRSPPLSLALSPSLCPPLCLPAGEGDTFLTTMTGAMHAVVWEASAEGEVFSPPVRFSL